MIAIALALKAAVAQALPLLNTLSNEEAARKPHPDKWSKKEILGHLIDSAGNNQQKFVRTMAQQHTDFPGYAQMHWVAVQQYQSADWYSLIAFWEAYNLHLAHVIEHTEETKLQNTISIEGAGPFTLAFIMSDYVEHLKHHLRQILPEAGIKSAFENVYGA
ncbi:MAG: DinB family protein [Spirosomataceae bacterium]